MVPNFPASTAKQDETSTGGGKMYTRLQTTSRLLRVMGARAYKEWLEDYRQGKIWMPTSC